MNDQNDINSNEILNETLTYQSQPIVPETPIEPQISQPLFTPEIPKKNSNKLIIVVVTILFLLLTGALLFYILNSNKASKLSGNRILNNNEVNNEADNNINEIKTTEEILKNNSGELESDIKKTIIMSNGLPCGNDFIDIRDGKKYPTVQIGNQCWFTENLAYTGNGCLNNPWTNQRPYNACTIHGPNEGENQGNYKEGLKTDMVLYQWEAAMDKPNKGFQGLCPVGWSIPSHKQWETLIDFVGLNHQVKLKASSPYWDGTNEFGFNALPSGSRVSTSYNKLERVGYNVYWWSSSPAGGGGRYKAFVYHMSSGESKARYFLDSQFQGNSVRCLIEN